MAPAATQWQGGAAEAAFLGTLSTDAPWELIHEFSNYVRESGTEGEQQAVDAITRRLTAWGIPHTVHHPRCFISLPRGATVTVSLTDGTARTLRGTTPGFAVPTGDAGITAPAVAIETAHATSVSTHLHLRPRQRTGGAGCGGQDRRPQWPADARADR